ncbi:MAG: AsmA family protein [Methylibium sp.]|uniref:AsmA family protein n=1 Tax=Methylibium sp. TaxID=2067992 RepID=UPI0018573E92|nr:AsmA family protein [Methylibium sp.]MBA3597244.1 AsmA family protein [Methylibium sp.]
MKLDGVDVKMRLEGKALAPLIPGADVPALHQPFSLESRLVSNGDVWKLSSIEGDLGESSLRGDALLDMSRKTPFIQADIKSRKLDVGFLKSLTSGKPDKPDATPQQFPGLDMLKTVNALVHLESSEITGTDLPLDDFALDLALEDGVLVINPFKLGVAGGKLVAEIRLDASVPEPTGKIAMRFDDVPVSPLLDPFVQTVDIGGIVDGQFTVGFSSDSIGTADGRLHYIAPKKGTDLTFKLDRVRNEQEWLLQVSVDGTFRGAPAQGSFTGQPFHLLDDPNAAVPVDLNLTLADTRAAIKGTVAELGNLINVNASMAGPGTDRLSRITAIDLPDLPGYKASGHIVRDHDTVKVEALRARLGTSDLAGSAIVRNMLGDGKPFIGLDLASETLAHSDFDQLFGKGGKSTDWLEQFDKLNANVEVAVKRAIAPKQVVFRNIRLDGVLKDGLFKLTLMRFQVAGGKVAANAAVRVDQIKGTDKKKSLRGTVKADVDNVHLAEALKPLGLGDNVPGWLNADIDIALGPEARKRTGKSTVRYDDRQGTNLEFALSQTPSATVLKGDGTFLSEPFRLSGTAGPLSRLVSDHRYPFDIYFKMLETSGQMAGSLREPLAFDGLKSSLEISGPNPRRAEPVVGFRLPELPPYRLKGDLFRQKDIWRFTDIKGTVGDSDLSGKIIVDNQKGKPYVNADLHSNMLDFDDLAGIIGGIPGTEPGEVASPAQKEKSAALANSNTVLPDEDFEFDVLSRFNADVRYDADRIDSDTLPLEYMTLNFSLKDGRLLVKPVLIGAAGGVVKANIRLVDKPGERPVRGEVELEVDRLRLENIANAYGIADESFGSIGGQATFQTRGESVAKMLASIDGQASFMMAGGALDAMLVELGGLDGGEALLTWLGKIRR